MFPGLQFPDIDAAITQYEGFYPGSRSYRNNNPGNLMYGPFASGLGAIGADPQGFAQFATVQQGFGAMDQLVASYSRRGYDLGSTLTSWNGGGANTPDYINFVSQKTGVDPHDPLSQAERDSNNASWWDAFLAAVRLNPADAAGAIGSVLDEKLGTQSVKNTAAKMIFGISFNRLGALILGILFIIAGLMSFKEVQQVVIQAGKTAVSAATVAA